MSITHTDNDSLNIPCGKLDLKNNLVVSKIKSNLPSVSQLIDDNVYLFEFNSFGFVIKVSEQHIIEKGHKQGKLFTFEDG